MKAARGRIEGGAAVGREAQATGTKTEADERQPPPHCDLIEVSKGEMMKTHGSENEMAMTTEIELAVEELEEMIAPGQSFNHNETLVRDTAQ